MASAAAVAAAPVFPSDSTENFATEQKQKTENKIERFGWVPLLLAIVDGAIRVRSVSIAQSSILYEDEYLLPRPLHTTVCIKCVHLPTTTSSTTIQHSQSYVIKRPSVEATLCLIDFSAFRLLFTNLSKQVEKREDEGGRDE